MEKLSLFFCIVGMFLLNGCALALLPESWSVEKKECKVGPNADSRWYYYDGTVEKMKPGFPEHEKNLNKEITKYINKHPELSPEIKKWMKDFHVVNGMNKEVVLLILGKPDNIEETYEFGAREKWLYRFPALYYKDEYHFYFKDDIIIKIISVQGGNIL